MLPQLAEPAAAVGAALKHSSSNCFLSAQQGFLRSWQASGFQKKVIDRISEIILSLKGKHKDVRVFVTGGPAVCVLSCRLGTTFPNTRQLSRAPM